MRVLVIGSGAREHALTWKFSQSKRIAGLYALPGNAGTDEVAENIWDVNPMDFDSVIKVCKEKGINLCYISPLAPLMAGLMDQLKKENIPVIGPHQKATQLETDRKFAKKFMNSLGIPTSRTKLFEDYSKFYSFIRNSSKKLVVKKSNAWENKAVLESNHHDELLNFGKKVLEKDALLAEEYLEGYEIAVFALSDGKEYKILPTCSDFKKAYDGDSGPNTGGMGALCPLPFISQETLKHISDKIIKPTFKGLNKGELNYKGVLRFDIIITQSGPRLLGYNVRCGDPETQVLLPLIESDLGNLTEAMLHGTLKDFPIRLSPQAALAVVVASQGYPGEFKKRIPVKSFPPVHNGNPLIFHSSTIKSEKDEILTTAGRCFTVVGLGNDLLKANKNAYEAASQLQFDGAWYRRDIGKRFLLDS